MEEPRVGHRITETVVTDEEQLVRCACGREATFARAKRNIYGDVLVRARAMSKEEFLCTGTAIAPRFMALKAVK